MVLESSEATSFRLGWACQEQPPNGSLQPRCEAQRSNVGCNPLLARALRFGVLRVTTISIATLPDNATPALVGGVDGRIGFCSF